MSAMARTWKAHVYGLFPLAQVPASIPRPDYAETGVPVSEMESRQQSIGQAIACPLPDLQEPPQ